MEVVVVLLVLMITATVVVFFMSDQAGLFGDFANDTSSEAQCSLWLAQYERRFCSSQVQTGSGSTLESKIQNNCNFSPQCQDGEAVRQ